MKQNKLFPAVVLALAASLAAVLFLMIRESGSTDTPRQIHVVIDDSSNNRWVQFIAGMQQAAEDEGVKVTVIPTSRLSSIEEEEALIERAIAGGTDGVIVQPLSDREAAGILENLSERTSIELVDEGTYEIMSNVVGIVSPDYEQIGEVLAMEAIRFAGKPFSQCTIGIVEGSPVFSSAQQKMDGFTKVIEEIGGQTAWVQEQTDDSGSLKDALAQHEIPDILVAMDNAALEAAGEYAASLEEDILVIGTGTSMKALYYLDSGEVQSIVVPEDYMMGYQSVSDLSEYIHKSRFLPQKRTISHRVIHKDTLFAEENQEILFPVQR